MKKTTLIVDGERQRFSDSERIDIVRQFQEWDGSRNEFCKKMKVNTQSLYAWQKKYGNEPVKETTEVAVIQPQTSAAQTAPQENVDYTILQRVNTDLRAENARLKVENDNLVRELTRVKKAFGEKLMELEMSKMSA